MPDNGRPSSPALARRDFLGYSVIGGVAGALAGGCAHTSGARLDRPGAGAASQPAAGAQAATAPPSAASRPAASAAQAGKPQIRDYRPLGRTGFKVSDIGLGCGRLTEPNLVRYAHDHGVNFFDTAEGYVNGDSERAIGKALAHLDRSKLFIVTKLKVGPGEQAASLVRRFHTSLGRLNTSYVDGLYMHSVTDVAMVRHPGFHAAVKRLKSEGKLRHAGISSHGPRGSKGDSMERVLLAAVEDGRFDLMLLVHSFINQQAGGKGLAACKARNVGATLMKTAPARLKLQPFDADNPSQEHARMLAFLARKGMSPKEAVAYLTKRLAQRAAEVRKNRQRIDRFVATHGIRTEEQLSRRSVQWALGAEGVSTVLVSMNDFESLDAFLPLSGTRLGQAGERQLRDWRAAFGADYCRHGCSRCAEACPRAVPVSTVMRYAYYYVGQRRQRTAMEKYARLGADNGLRCLDCAAPCLTACPHQVQIPAQLLTAHQLLTLDRGPA